MANNNDINVKLNVEDNLSDDLTTATENLEQTAKAADKAGFSFKNFAFNAAGVVTSLISVSINLAKLAANYLGLTVEIETTNKKLKVFDFFVQNVRKEVTISLGFLKRFADFLRSINFPIKPLTNFIDLLGDFRVKIGVGQGEKTLFDHTADGLKKAAGAAKEFQLDDFRGQIKDAITSLLLFSAQAATTFASLKKGVEREASFSAASRTIAGTKDELAALKVQIDDISSTNLAIDTAQLYEVAGIAGAMGKSLEEIPAFIQLVSEAAIAFNIPAGEVAEKLATIQTQLSLTDEGVISLADQVNALADSMPGKVNELDVFTTLSTGVASAGKSFGLLKGETIALVGSLLSLGEAPETARTAIVSLLTKLQTASVGTKDFQAALAQMGTSADKLKEDIRTKPMPTLVAFLKQLKGFDEFKKKELLVGIMGTGGDMNAVSKLTDTVDLLEKSLVTATDATQYSGSVHKAYQQQIATSAAKITLLKNALENFTERLTSTFLPAINIVVDGITKMVNALSTFSQDHPVLKTIVAVTVSTLSMAGALRLLTGASTLLFGKLSGKLAPIWGLIRTGLIRAAVAAGFAATAFNGLGIGGVIAVIRAGSAFAALRVAMLWLFGGTIGLAIGGITLLFVAISNLLPVTIKWGETTSTVGRVISESFAVIVNRIKETTDALIELGLQSPVITGIAAAAGVAGVAIKTGLVSALATLITTYGGVAAAAVVAWAATLTPITLVIAGLVAVGAAMEAAAYAINGRFVSIGEIAETFVNNFIRTWQMLGVFLASTFNDIIIRHQFFSEALAAIFDDSTIEDAQNRRDAKLLAEEQRFSDEISRIMDNNPLANFSRDVEIGLNATQELATPDKRRAADIGKSPAEIDQEAIEVAKKQADLIAQIEKETRDKRLADLRTEEAEKIRLIENSGKTQKQIDDEVFAAKMESGKKLSEELQYRLLEEKTALEQISTRQRIRPDGSLEFYDAEKKAEEDLLSLKSKNLSDLKSVEDKYRDSKLANSKELIAAEKADIQDKFDAAKKAINDELVADRKSQQDKLLARKESLKQIQADYKANIDALNTLEQQHRDKVKSIQEEIKNLKKSEVDGLRELARTGMSDAEITADKELEIQQKTAQFRQLMGTKEYEQAAALGKELNALVMEQGKARIESAKATGDTSAVAAAQYDYQQSLLLTNDALNKQAAAEQAKADAAAFQAELQRKAYENVGNQIESLNNTLTTGAKLDMIIDSTQLDELKAKIDALPKEKVIQIKWSSDKEFTDYNKIKLPETFVAPRAILPAGTGTITDSKRTVQIEPVKGDVNVWVDFTGLQEVEPTVKKWALEAANERIKIILRTNQ